MNWAGHNFTDNKAGKGESEGQSLGNGTCPVSLLACDDSRESTKTLKGRPFTSSAELPVTNLQPLQVPAVKFEPP